ncbi:FAD-binding protein [Arthrobacter sp. BB-1]|jgi:2-polyprenyl-6-methoxyphenol hydroxylase-like FAD-dependent oxidoreductase|uniref:FAD-dependent monooxygenase n=1 Tax=Micrococcaceae TaxID=1268 RepID=UPI0011120BA8|nr:MULTISPECIES: FAD-dependent monooxygenase [Micrococcaceae]TNB76324.1 FAD-binding protein [Arthrobacter sp. BB-1]UEL30301.1 NAD(P)-binding protein [Pseudarthrobacter sp. L1SW]
MPGNAGTEQTTTVIIGTGLSGLAVAAELCRRGVDSIVVDGLDILGAAQPANTASLQRCDAADSATLRERNEILRHLRNYAASHAVDVRHTTRAVQLTMLDGPGTAAPQWEVHTPTGILVADHIVLTRCAHSQLRRMINDFGIAVGRNLAAAMRAIGIYLVGVGELITPSPKEVLRQAKTVGQAISAKVHPDSVAFPGTGSFAALPC